MAQRPKEVSKEVAATFAIWPTGRQGSSLFHSASAAAGIARPCPAAFKEALGRGNTISPRDRAPPRSDDYTLAASAKPASAPSAIDKIWCLLTLVQFLHTTLDEIERSQKSGDADLPVLEQARMNKTPISRRQLCGARWPATRAFASARLAMRGRQRMVPLP